LSLPAKQPPDFAAGQSGLRSFIPNEELHPCPASCKTTSRRHRLGSGIGRAIALGYAREGAELAVLDINGEAAAKTAADIRGAGGKAQHFTLDVTDRAPAARPPRRSPRKPASLILVNNAGINRRQRVHRDADAVIKDCRTSWR